MVEGSSRTLYCVSSLNSPPQAQLYRRLVSSTGPSTRLPVRHFQLVPRCSSGLLTLFALQSPRFGTVATVLEMIPLASILFSFTNTGKSLPCLWSATG